MASSSLQSGARPFFFFLVIILTPTMIPALMAALHDAPASHMEVSKQQIGEIPQQGMDEGGVGSPTVGYGGSGGDTGGAGGGGGGSIGGGGGGDTGGVGGGGGSIGGGGGGGDTGGVGGGGGSIGGGGGGGGGSIGGGSGGGSIGGGGGGGSIGGGGGGYTGGGGGGSTGGGGGGYTGGGGGGSGYLGGGEGGGIGMPMAPGHGTCNFWSSNFGSWPDIMSTLSTITSVFGKQASSMFGGGMTLLQALQNNKDDAYSRLLREATASLLNSYAYNGFPFTPQDVKNKFGAAMASANAATAQASEFGRANTDLK